MRQRQRIGFEKGYTSETPPSNERQRIGFESGTIYENQMPKNETQRIGFEDGAVYRNKTGEAAPTFCPQCSQWPDDSRIETIDGYPCHADCHTPLIIEPADVVGSDTDETRPQEQPTETKPMPYSGTAKHER